MLLSLDVGFRNTGWVVFDNKKPVACGCIQTEKSKHKLARNADDNARRSAEIARHLKNIILEYNVKGIVGELPSGGAQSAKAMAQMALATGVVSAVASVLELPVSWTTPNSVKLATTGKRSAEKVEVMEAVKKRYEYFEFPKQVGVFEHIADACGAYLALEADNLVLLFG